MGKCCNFIIQLVVTRKTVHTAVANLTATLNAVLTGHAIRLRTGIVLLQVKGQNLTNHVNRRGQIQEQRATAICQPREVA